MAHLVHQPPRLAQASLRRAPTLGRVQQVLPECGEGLGVRGPITSPTFVIARVHPSLIGGPALVHADAYRIGGVAEIDDLDLDSSTATSVTAVEWGEGLAEGLSDDRLEIAIELQGDGRAVRLTGIGARWADLPAALGPLP